MKEQIQLSYNNIPLSATVAKALASEMRLQILKTIKRRPMNISEIAEQLGIPISTAAMHIRLLEEAGVVVTQSLPGLRGNQKVCGIKAQRVEFLLFEEETEDKKNCLVQDMPIGNYFDCNIVPPCGIVSQTGFIGQEDNVSGFYSSQKHTAELIWFSRGYLEYRFTNYQIKRIQNISSVSFSFEICSEAPAYNNTWKSDITLWINGQELGTMRCNGDYGGRPGKQNPDWWSMDFTQYGELRSVEITQDATYFDHQKIAEIGLEQLGLFDGDYITFRIGLKDESKYVGGLNLFGEKFGDYDQSIIMKILY